MTGARGLLGISLGPYMRAKGYLLSCHPQEGSSEVRVDFSQPDQARSVLDDAKPDVIINLAALTNVDECERRPQLAYLSNVRTVENLARWIRSHGDRCHLVQISTDQVYDGTGPHKEADIVLSNYYGFSKYAGELAASLVPSTILRTNFFGPSQIAGRASLSDWLLQSLRHREPITVFDDVCFSPLSIQRLVSLIDRVVDRRLQGVFNLGSRQGMSKADFAFALADTMDLPTDAVTRGPSTQVPLKAYRPKDMRMDSSRFEDAFGIQLPTLQEELNSMKAAYAPQTR